jgi:hypothetical protein
MGTTLKKHLQFFFGQSVIENTQSLTAISLKGCMQSFSAIVIHALSIYYTDACMTLLPLVPLEIRELVA